MLDAFVILATEGQHAICRNAPVEPILLMVMVMKQAETALAEDFVIMGTEHANAFPDFMEPNANTRLPFTKAYKRSRAG